MSEHVEAEGLDPDEPSTPLWLTLLGGALFVAAGLWVLLTGGESENQPPAEAPAADVAEAAPAARPSAPKPSAPKPSAPAD
jgi:hypothetical protein